ncbi:hemolysin-III related-domain-containing protein [Lasiosphaeris hirsuta]|uniref:Hemolysin-III related-domain-containing protein n=1 Tax=Lasiosphaeris hirsuta TaxID=260670 RepID=A0AA40E9L9_9PEZI|nr:hemolysin-III related-domain-containing protein [Lasiosphaeris hirsuta]
MAPSHRKKTRVLNRASSQPPRRQLRTKEERLDALVTARGPGKLLSNKQVPSWYSEPLIYSGYRPVNYSVKLCFRSLACLHNETVNIFSHLLPASAALGLSGLVPWFFDAHFPDAVWQDRLVFQTYLATCALCFAVSALYHAFLCHSERYRHLWVRFDYAAILLQILGSFISGIYIGFYCEPVLQRMYWSLIGALSLLSAAVVLNPRFQSGRWRRARVCSFAATGFSAFTPIIHAAVIFPYRQLDQQAGLRYYYIEGILVLIGTFHYMSHFPESWKPGKFDIWGASHQVFHIFVVLSAIVHLYGITSAFKWNYENPRCPAGVRDIGFV